MNAYVTRHWKSGFLQRKHGREMLAGLFILVSCMLFLAPVASLAASATVFVEGVPGGVIVNTVEVNTKVIVIDLFHQVHSGDPSAGRSAGRRVQGC